MKTRADFRAEAKRLIKAELAKNPNDGVRAMSQLVDPPESTITPIADRLWRKYRRDRDRWRDGMRFVAMSVALTIINDLSGLLLGVSLFTYGVIAILAGTVAILFAIRDAQWGKPE